MVKSSEKILNTIVLFMASYRNWGFSFMMCGTALFFLFNNNLVRILSGLVIFSGFVLISIFKKSTVKLPLTFVQYLFEYPNEAFDWLRAHPECWMIYIDKLPEDYKEHIPTKYIRPLRFYVPKIGNRIVYAFGKDPEYIQNEEEFISFIHTIKGIKQSNSQKRKIE